MKMDESAGSKHSFFVVHQADTPTPLLYRFLAVTTPGLRAWGFLGAIDPRHAPVRQAVLRGLLQLLSVRKITGAFLKSLQQRFRTFVRRTHGMEPQRHFPGAKGIRQTLTEAR